MLMRAAWSLRSLRRVSGARRTTGLNTKAFCSHAREVGSNLAVSGAPSSTALEGSKAADVAARLEAMESEQLGLVPHEERMQQMGALIQNEYKEAGLELTDLSIGEGAEAVPGEVVREFLSRFAAMCFACRRMGPCPH